MLMVSSSEKERKTVENINLHTTTFATRLICTLSVWRLRAYVCSTEDGTRRMLLERQLICVRDAQLESVDQGTIS